MKHIHLLFLGSLLVCSSCSTENTLEPEEVKLLVSIDGAEKSRVNLDGDKFENNDKFAFFFMKSEPTAEPTSWYKYSSSTGWDYEGQRTYWDDQEEREDLYRYFCATLPFDPEYYEINGNVFTVEDDQTLDTDYKKSDLLIARVYTNKRLIPIKFYHAFSRVIVKITASSNSNNPDGYFDVADFEGMSVTLNNVKLTGNLDYSDEPEKNDITYDPKIGVEATGNAESVTMYSIDSNPKANGTAKTVTSTFYAIVPPQIISVQPLLTININTDGTDKTYYFKTTDVKFEKGKATTINLTLDKSKVELSAATNIEISDWKGILAEDGKPIVLE